MLEQRVGEDCIKLTVCEREIVDARHAKRCVNTEVRGVMPTGVRQVPTTRRCPVASGSSYYTVVRVIRYWSKGIPGEPSKSEILGYWIHSLAAAPADPF
jgi:hypothetical protein